MPAFPVPLAAADEALPSDHWFPVNIECIICAALCGQGKFVEADELLRKEKVPGAGIPFAAKKARCRSLGLAIRFCREGGELVLAEELSRLLPDVSLIDATHSKQSGDGD